MRLEAKYIHSIAPPLACKLASPLSKEADMRDAVLALSMVGAVACAGGAQQKCGELPACGALHKCVDGACYETCAAPGDCTQKGQRCEDGICVIPADAECASDGDCTTPGNCQAEPGSCADARCFYASKSCETSPPDACVEGDTVLRAYAASGYCDTDTGECTYSYLDTACVDCAKVCLGQGNACTQNATCGADSCTGGACTCLGGACQPKSDTGGSCDSSDDADCTLYHNCISNICLLEDGQTCSNNGECVHVCISAECAPLSGDAGLCDIADGDADCLSGYACTDGVCKRNDGEPCQSDGQCVHTCAIDTCALPGQTGDPCDSPADCDVGYTCGVSSTCEPA